MEEAKSQFRDINKYDYEKTMIDFEKKGKIKELEKKKVERAKKLNDEYFPKVKEMNKFKKQDEEEKIKKTEIEIKQKNERHSRVLERIKLENEHKFRLDTPDKLDRQQKVRKNYEKNKIKEEERRLKEGEVTQKRLEKISECNQKLKKERRLNFEKQAKENQEKYEKYIVKREKDYEEFINKKEQEIFNKYKYRFIERQKRQDLRKEAKLENKKHLERIQEVLEENEKKRLEDQKRYIEKLDRMTSNRIKKEEENKIKVESFIEQQRDKYENAQLKRRQLNLDIEKKREDVLERQRGLFNMTKVEINCLTSKDEKRLLNKSAGTRSFKFRPK